MKINVKKEIVNSYEKLISDCEKAIENEVEVENNLKLMNEYKRVLNKVKLRPASAYSQISKKTEEAFNAGLQSPIIHDLKYKEV